MKSNLLTYCMTGIVGAGLMATPASAVDGIINEDNLKGIEYREVGPVRGGRVTTVVGDSQTYYMGSMGGVWKTGQRSFWRLARSAWRAIPHEKRTPRK